MSLINSLFITLDSQPYPPISHPAALLTLLSVVAAIGQRGRGLNDFFLGSLEMSAPIFSAWKKEREEAEGVGGG